MKIKKQIDITELTEKYGLGYVAKNKKTGKIVANASSVDLLFAKIKAKNLTKEELVIS